MDPILDVSLSSLLGPFRLEGQKTALAVIAYTFFSNADDSNSAIGNMRFNNKAKIQQVENENVAASG